MARQRVAEIHVILIENDGPVEHHFHRRTFGDHRVRAA